MESLESRFAELDASRRELETRFAATLEALRGRQLAPDTARDLQQRVGKVRYFLSLPLQLGAFESVEAVERELRKLRSATRQLDKVDAVIRSLDESD